MTAPYGGQITWQYTAFTLQGPRTVRELQNRYVLTKPGATLMSYQLTRDPGDANRSIHLYGQWFDWNANASKVWWFETDTNQPQVGLQTAYEGRTLSTGVALTREEYTWGTDPGARPYPAGTVTRMNPGQAGGMKKQATQTLDVYGNASAAQVYDFVPESSSFGTARSYSNTYVSDQNYTGRKIYNRLLTSSVNGVMTVQNCYDGTVGSPCAGGLSANVTSMTQHDGAYGTGFYYRGNVSATTSFGVTASNLYDIGGNVVSTTRNGATTTLTTTAATNYAAPSAVTTNALTTSLSWSGFLGLTQETGPNQDSASTVYDSIARPQSSTSPYGAVTYYQYNNTPGSASRLEFTGSHGTLTKLDGFGRPIEVDTGTVSGNYPYAALTATSVVQTVYAACGCSPLGKVTQVSRPYNGGSPVWTTYTYDALGRTTDATAPDGSVTHYTYLGNTVKVKDTAGNEKTYTMDGFGNLTQVAEPGGLTTSYQYDVLNRLTDVTMPRSSGTQTRSFDYTVSGVPGGFLRSATNPCPAEAWHGWEVDIVPGA